MRQKVIIITGIQRQTNDRYGFVGNRSTLRHTETYLFYNSNNTFLVGESSSLTVAKSEPEHGWRGTLVYVRHRAPTGTARIVIVGEVVGR